MTTSETAFMGTLGREIDKETGRTDTWRAKGMANQDMRKEPLLTLQNGL
jgi:hypothetical protein